jgi:hypothetical protein
LHLIPLLIQMKHKFKKKQKRHNRNDIIRRRYRLTSFLDYLTKNVQTLRQICLFFLNPCRNGSNAGCVK